MDTSGYKVGQAVEVFDGTTRSYWFGYVTRIVGEVTLEIENKFGDLELYAVDAVRPKGGKQQMQSES